MQERPVQYTGPVQPDGVFQFIQAHAKNLFILADGRLGGGSVPIEIQKNGRVILPTDRKSMGQSGNSGGECSTSERNADGTCRAGTDLEGTRVQDRTVVGFGSGASGLKAWFEANGLARWLDIFLELGVEDLADLAFVTVEDMQGMGMPLIQQRKFKAAFEASSAASIRDPLPPSAAPVSNKPQSHHDGRKLQENRRNQWQQRRTSATLI